jgi:hypothetical protein
VEYTFNLSDTWQKRLFLALCRRNELTPYRYARQRYTTVMVQVPKRFVKDTLWPEYLELAKTLEEHLAGITERVIAKVLHSDATDVETRPELPPSRSAGGGRRPARAL